MRDAKPFMSEHADETTPLAALIFDRDEIINLRDLMVTLAAQSAVTDHVRGASESFRDFLDDVLMELPRQRAPEPDNA